MERPNPLTSVLTVGTCILMFIIMLVWRNYRQANLERDQLYGFAQIKTLTASLRSGNSWKYEFTFNTYLYDGYIQTHIAFDVKPRQFYLVRFSESDPENNELLYEYRLLPGSDSSYLGKQLPPWLADHQYGNGRIF